MLSAITTYMPRWLMAIIATALVLAAVVGSNQDTAQAIDPADTDTVYIADGTNFADALMGATIASLNTSPMLGVAGTNGGDTIPGDTVAELDRLTNNKADLLDTIFIFGGTAAVSADVANQLGQWADDVQRIEGDSRWGTYQAISQLLPAAVDEAVHAQEADNADTLDGLDANAISRVAYDFDPGTARDGTSGVAASTTITAPTDGLLVLSGSLNLRNSSMADLVHCFFRVDGTNVLDNWFSQIVDGNGTMGVVNMSLDGVEPVASGSHPVDIYCHDVDFGTEVTDPFLVVQFVPFGADGTQPTP